MHQITESRIMRDSGPERLGSTRPNRAQCSPPESESSPERIMPANTAPHSTRSNSQKLIRLDEIRVESYTGPDRRCGDRRSNSDRRTEVRFDLSNSDRRSKPGRRSTDGVALYAR